MAGFRVHDDGPTLLRVIPHPAVTVAVTIGGDRFEIRDPWGRTHSGDLALGLTDAPCAVRFDDIECVQVRLSPLAASAVLRLPLAELASGAVRLDDLWGRDATRLSERLNETCSWPGRFALIRAALAARRCDDRRRAAPEVAWAWHRIVSGRGRFRVEHLAAEVGWSRQRLWSRFSNQIGLSPKRAAMLVRFDNAMHQLVRGLSPAQVAADTGYADQPHLHRDVQRFTGNPLTSAAGEPWLAVDDEAWPSSTAD